jgi:hypothetical protein
MAFFEPEKPFPEAEGKDLDPDPDEPAHEKMAEFMDEDQDAEDDQEGQDLA